MKTAMKGGGVLRRDWPEGRRLPSPDALIERVQLVGLQRAALEHLAYSRLDASEAYKQAQVKGQHAIGRAAGQDLCTVPRHGFIGVLCSW